MNNKPTKFSYSKLNTFESCGWKFFLQYDEGHYIYSDSLASELGSLIHFCEESIARELQAGRTPDYDKLRGLLAVGTDKLAGLDALKQKYREEYFATDDRGDSYYSRVLDYLDTGIYRLETFMKEHPTYVVYGMEQYFSVEFSGQVLSGYIDRIFYDPTTGMYHVEDIKTRNKLFRDQDLATPLQFVVYVYALSENLGVPYDKFDCTYDLPFLHKKQAAGTSGFMARGLKKLRELFEEVASGDRTPRPSPLCFYCSFCAHNPHAPEEGKYLCPYYSLWTPDDRRNHAVNHVWEGKERAPEILAQYLLECAQRAPKRENDGTELDF